MTGLTLRGVNLRALNSATKYPSIPTYHRLDPRSGGLLTGTVPFTGPVVGTEKVDGANARVILLPDGSYLLGSREDLLYAQGDPVGNRALGIVDALQPFIDATARTYPLSPHLLVLYLELYGVRGTGNAKQYSTAGRPGWRLFDVAEFTSTEVLGWDVERIASWRDRGGQTFLDEDALTLLVNTWFGLDLTPRLFTLDAAELPTDLDKTLVFLRDHLPRTRAAVGDHPPGHAEGIVLRSADRTAIAKARFADYERTIRRCRS